MIYDPLSSENIRRDRSRFRGHRVRSEFRGHLDGVRPRKGNVLREVQNPPVGAPLMRSWL